MPSISGGLSISSSTCKITCLPPSGELEPSFQLQELAPLGRSGDCCWHGLFDSGTVTVSPPYQKRKYSDEADKRGLRLPFDLMVQLAAVELPVLVDDGVVLVGYQTTLVPIFLSNHSMQWHIETSLEGALNPYNLESTQQSWFKTGDWEVPKKYRCFLGWCQLADVNPGTENLKDQVYRSTSKAQRRTLHWTGISLGGQVVLANPLQAGITGQATFSWVNNILRFRPSSGFAKLLKDTSKEVAIIVDSGDARSWLAPKLTLMLHMAHAWSAYYSVNPDPIPYANPFHDGTQAEIALQNSGDLILSG